VENQRTLQFYFAGKASDCTDTDSQVGRPAINSTRFSKQFTLEKSSKTLVQETVNM